MAPYTIKQYTLNQAKRLGVVVKPSTRGTYKIDVFTPEGVYITSVGHKAYKDYPTYILEKGLPYATRRRELYKMRHEKDRHITGSRGFYADQLLW